MSWRGRQSWLSGCTKRKKWPLRGRRVLACRSLSCISAGHSPGSWLALKLGQGSPILKEKTMFSPLYLSPSSNEKTESEKWKSHSHVWLCDPMDCNLPGSSVHRILQARILEWVAISFSRGSSRPRDRTQVSFIASRFFANWANNCPHMANHAQFFWLPPISPIIILKHISGNISSHPDVYLYSKCISKSYEFFTPNKIAVIL